MYSECFPRHNCCRQLAQGKRGVLSRIDRYLIKEVALSFAATIVVLLAITLCFRLVAYLTQVASGALAQDAILMLLGLQAIRLFILLISPALLLSIMLTLGRLYRDSEMVALAACGVSPVTLYRPLWLLGVPLALLAGWLSLHVVPMSVALLGELEQLARQNAQVAIVTPGTFREALKGQLVIYADGLSEDGRELSKVFVLHRRPQGTAVMTGKRGYLETDPVSRARYVVLADGYRYVGSPGQQNFQTLHFERLSILVDLPPPDPAQQRRQGMSTAALWASDDKADIAQFHERLSNPLAVLLVVFVTPLLARAQPREGRYGKVVAAVLVFAIYINLLGVGQSWLAQGVIPPGFGLWWAHGLFALLGFALWMHHYGGGFRFANRQAVRISHETD